MLPGDDALGVTRGPPADGTQCYRTVLFGPGKDMFLEDADVVAAKHRLSRVVVYRDYLKQKAQDAGESSSFKVAFLTNRQKRLTAYYKVFKYIYTKGRYKVVLPLPTCVCLRIRKWWPDDDDDHKMRGEEGVDDAADSNVVVADDDGGEDND